MMFLLSLMVSWASIPLPVHSAQGKHCRTAKVQKLIEKQVVLDCCGNPVIKKVQRSPKPGDKDFQQCNCAEKQAATQFDSKELSGLQLLLLSCWVPLEQFVLPIPLIISANVTCDHKDTFARLGSAPDPPPPQF